VKDIQVGRGTQQALGLVPNDREGFCGRGNNWIIDSGNNLINVYQLKGWRQNRRLMYRCVIGNFGLLITATGRHLLGRMTPHILSHLHPAKTCRIGCKNHCYDDENMSETGNHFQTFRGYFVFPKDRQKYD
jgi:hypothetical protein